MLLFYIVCCLFAQVFTQRETCTTTIECDENPRLFCVSGRCRRIECSVDADCPVQPYAPTNRCAVSQCSDAGICLVRTCAQLAQVCLPAGGCALLGDNGEDDDVPSSSASSRGLLAFIIVFIVIITLVLVVVWCVVSHIKNKRRTVV